MNKLTKKKTHTRKTLARDQIQPSNQSITYQQAPMGFNVSHVQANTVTRLDLRDDKGGSKIIPHLFYRIIFSLLKSTNNISFVLE